MEEFQDFAILEYRVNMRLDSLPIAEMNRFAYDGSRAPAAHAAHAPCCTRCTHTHVACTRVCLRMRLGRSSPSRC
eukprot:1117500-Rhodomonas_salina.5